MVRPHPGGSLGVRLLSSIIRALLAFFRISQGFGQVSLVFLARLTPQNFLPNPVFNLSRGH